MSDPMRRGTWLTRPVRRWLERAESNHAINTCGGDQRCPWCRQWVNQFEGTRIAPLKADLALDEITCGNCGGASAWKWEIGFIFVCSTVPPPAADLPPGWTDGPFIRDVIARIRTALAGGGQ